MAKHQQIFESLREQIASGAFEPSRRLPSENALAHRFGVSRPTAARALRDLQAEGLVERRVGSGTYVCEVASTADAPGLAVGLYAPGLKHTEVLEPICSEIMRLGQLRGMNVIWSDREGDHTNARHAQIACRRLINQGVKGVFFAPHELLPERQTLNRRVAETLKADGIAVVLLDRDLLEFPGRSDFDLVSIDHYQSAFVLTNHLLGLGRRRFCFVAMPEYPSTTDLRIAGCREAVSRRGLSLSRHWLKIGDPIRPAFVKAILKATPDAIVCSNDRTAALLLQTIAGMGLELPRGASIVGFDDVQYATLLSIPLTTIRQPCDDLAGVAVQVMRERIGQPDLPPRSTLIQGELMIRKSSGDPT